MRPEDVEIILDAEMNDDPVFVVEVITPLGSPQVMGEFEIDSRTIVIREMHLGGDPATTWGWSRLRMLGRLIAEKLDVDEICIHGAVRTTGANPGRRPRVVRLSRAAQPDLPAGRRHS